MSEAVLVADNLSAGYGSLVIQRDLNFSIKKVFPSWYIVFVGIAVGSVTANVHGMERIGQAAFWF